MLWFWCCAIVKLEEACVSFSKLRMVFFSLFRFVYSLLAASFTCSSFLSSPHPSPPEHVEKGNVV